VAQLRLHRRRLYLWQVLLGFEEIAVGNDPGDGAGAIGNRQVGRATVSGEVVNVAGGSDVGGSVGVTGGVRLRSRAWDGLAATLWQRLTQAIRAS
jgi:hypothetical protein